MRLVNPLVSQHKKGKLMSKLFHALRILLVTTIPAQANMPPKTYDKPYNGDMQTHLVEYGQAWKKCLSLGAKVARFVDGRHLYGCQFFIGSLCVIVISKSKKDKTMLSNVYRHERAHCNGWSH